MDYINMPSNRSPPYTPVDWMKKEISKAQLEQRRMASRSHTARSQVVARRRAGYVKQSVLQAAGIRYADLDLIARRYLDLYARVQTKVELYDAWVREHGFLDEEGRTPPWIKEYYAAINTAGRLLARVEEHLRRHQQAGPSPLELHLSRHYDADGDVA